MSAEDWEGFKALREERRAKRAVRRAAFVGGPGWTKHHDTHWSYVLNGDQLDYWPGRHKWRHGGRTHTGDVLGYIRNREAKYG